MANPDRADPAEDATSLESPARPLERPRTAPKASKLPKAVQTSEKRPTVNGKPRKSNWAGKGRKLAWEDREAARDAVGSVSVVGEDGAEVPDSGAEHERSMSEHERRSAMLAAARAREPAIAAWADLIAAGKTERFAAAMVEESHGVTFRQMATKCQNDPVLDAIRAAGHEACAQRYLDEIERLGREGIPREHGEHGRTTRQDARILATRIAALQWLLAVKDRKYRVSTRQDDAPVQSGPAVTVVLADARSLARDADGDPPAVLPASPEAARRLRR